MKDSNTGKMPINLIAFDPQKDGSLGEFMSFKRGGSVNLKSAASSVMAAGRHGDTMLIHVNPEEFGQIREMWGDPIVNPETGIPEYGFLKSLKKIIGKVAPILSVASLIPGMQWLSPLAMMGKGVTALTGIGGAAANAIGGAALGGFTGGKKGAVVGGISGFAGTPGTPGSPSPVQNLGSKFMPNASQSTQLALGRGALGAGGAALTGGNALQGGLTAAMVGGMSDSVVNSDMVQNGLAGSPVLQNAALGAAKGADMSAMTGGDYKKGALIGAGVGAADAALQKFMPEQFGYREAEASPGFTGPKEADYQAPMPSSVMSANFGNLVSQVSGLKTREEVLQTFAQNPDQRPVYDALSNWNVCDTSSDFGGCLAQNWDSFMGSIRTNAPSVMKAKTGGLAMALGGEVTNQELSPLEERQLAVGGEGDGQDDFIDAKLSDGEFIIPADVVSALGSGSTDAGSKALYAMVCNIRDSYRSAHRDDIPPKAISPLEYMRGAQ